MFGISSLGTISIEEIGSTISTPKLFQLYFHKDRGLTNSMIERCIAANFDAPDRRYDHGRKPGTRLADRLHLAPALDAQKPRQLRHAPEVGGQLFHAREVRAAPAEGLRERGFEHLGICRRLFQHDARPINELEDAADVRKKWGKQFCLKGIMSIADAKRAVGIGATAIMVSNHGGRQLDGSRSPFDQLAEIVDAVGDRIDVICDGGITRGTHVLKALSVGAKACSGGRLYLYALAAAGQAGVERALENLRAEIERDMKLMGCRSVDQLSRDNLRFR